MVNVRLIVEIEMERVNINHSVINSSFGLRGKEGE